MDKERLYRQTAEITDEMITFRRELHRRPELSFQEHATASAIIGMLEKEGIACRRIAGTGVLARIDGTEPSDCPVILRADIDALPVTESGSLDCVSLNHGVMHACGHDLHAAMLMGALYLLSRNCKSFSGTVLGLFQPGEEQHPGGASIVLGQGVFDGLQPRAFIGQHVSPEIPAGKFGFREGMYMASGDEIHFRIFGTGGHGGLPHTLTDPVVAAAQIITSLQTITSRYVPAEIPTVLSFGKIVAEGATNVIPSEVYVAGTLRTMSETWRRKAKERIRQIIQSTCAAYDVTCEIDIKDGFPNVINDPAITRAVRSVTEELIGPGNVLDLDIRMTAEDFGFYTQRYPSVFYRIGVGFGEGAEPCRLHTSDFRANEAAIGKGIAVMTAAALRFLDE